MLQISPGQKAVKCMLLLLSLAVMHFLLYLILPESCVLIDVLRGLGELSVDGTSTVRRWKKLCIPRHRCRCIRQLFSSVTRRRHRMVVIG